MGFFSNWKAKRESKKSSKKTVTIKSTTKPTATIVSKDYGTATTERTGGTTVATVSTPSSGGGGSSSSGGRKSITTTSTGKTPSTPNQSPTESTTFTEILTQPSFNGVDSYQGPAQKTISPTSGNLKYEKRDYTKKDFGDKTSIPKFGTSTQSFAGYENGKPTYIDSSYKTYGDLMLEDDSNRMGIQAEYQRNTQDAFEEYSDPLIQKRVSGYQEAVNLGNLDVETAQKNLNEDINSIGSDFLKTNQYLELSSKAEKDLSEANRGVSSLLLEQTAPESLGKKIVSYTPIVGSSIDLVKSGRELSKSYNTMTSAESLIGSGNVNDSAVNKAGLRFAGNAGMLALDVAMFSGGAKLVRSGIQKKIVKSLSKQKTKLSASEIKSLGISNLGDGRFAQAFIQESGGLTRRGVVQGTMIKTPSGLSFSPYGAGISETSGKVGLSRSNKIAAKLLGEPTNYLERNTFEIASAGISRPTGRFGKVLGSQNVGIGTFSPIKSSGFLYKKGATKREILDLAKENLKLGGSTVTDTFKIPTFSMIGEKGGFSLSKTKTSTGINFAKPTNSGADSGIKIFKNSGKKTPFSKSFNDLGVQSVRDSPNLGVKSLRIPQSPSSQILQQSGKSTSKTEVPSILKSGFKNEIKINKNFLGKTGKGFIGEKAFLGIGAKTAFNIDSGIKSSFIFKNNFKDSTKLNQQFNLKPSTKTSTSYFTDLTKTSSNSPSFGGGGNIIPPKIPLPKIPFLPKLPNLQFGTAGGTGRFSATRLYEYSPSFGAYLFNIESSKKTKAITLASGRQVYSGFETRAIVKPKSKTTREVKAKKT